MKKDRAYFQSDVYDLESITRASCWGLGFYLLCLLLSVCVSVLCVIAILIYGSNLLVFIVALVCLVVSLGGAVYQIKSTRLGALRSGIGNIREVHKEVVSVRNVVGGDIGLFKRRFDAWRRDDIRCGVFVGEGEDVHLHQLNGITEKQAEYYDSAVGDEVVYIFAARFPVKHEVGEEYMCPICGEFNSREKKTCSACGCKVLR